MWQRVSVVLMAALIGPVTSPQCLVQVSVGGWWLPWLCWLSWVGGCEMCLIDPDGTGDGCEAVVTLSPMMASVATLQRLLVRA